MDDNWTTPGQAYAEIGPTHASNCSDNPVLNSKPKPTVPAKIRNIVAELGLRYRPSAQADLEAHAASIALLCRDVADVPPGLLERAVEEWVRSSVFMPKAADLVALAKGYLGSARPDASVGFDPSDWLHELAARYNAARVHHRTEWYVSDQNELKLRWTKS